MVFPYKGRTESSLPLSHFLSFPSPSPFTPLPSCSSPSLSISLSPSFSRPTLPWEDTARRDLPTSQKRAVASNPISQRPASRTVGKIHNCCVNRPACGIWLQQPEQIQRSGRLLNEEDTFHCFNQGLFPRPGRCSLTWCLRDTPSWTGRPRLSCSPDTDELPLDRRPFPGARHHPSSILCPPTFSFQGPTIALDFC